MVAIEEVIPAFDRSVDETLHDLRLFGDHFFRDHQYLRVGRVTIVRKQEHDWIDAGGAGGKGFACAAASARHRRAAAAGPSSETVARRIAQPPAIPEDWSRIQRETFIKEEVPRAWWHFWATDGTLFKPGEGRDAVCELLERVLEYAPDTIVGSSYSFPSAQ
jgi:hypothetical protein